MACCAGHKYPAAAWSIRLGHTCEGEPSPSPELNSPKLRDVRVFPSACSFRADCSHVPIGRPIGGRKALGSSPLRVTDAHAPESGVKTRFRMGNRRPVSGLAHRFTGYSRKFESIHQVLRVSQHILLSVIKPESLEFLTSLRNNLFSAIVSSTLSRWRNRDRNQNYHAGSHMINLFWF